MPKMETKDMNNPLTLGHPRTSSHDTRLIADFIHIVKETRAKLLALCQSFFDRQEMACDAEDAVQETYLRLWQMRARMAEYRSPEALATMIAKNICIDILKQHSARVEPLHETTDAIDNAQTDQLAMQHDTERLLQRAMQKLPTTKRKMLLMRSDGMSMEEIAAACGTTAASAKTMICAARKELISILKIRRTKI